MLRRPAILCALLLLAACTDDALLPTTPPATPPATQASRELGLIEVTLSGIGTSGMTASVRPVVPGITGPGATAAGLQLNVSAVPGGDGSIQLEPLSTGSFTDGTRGSGGVRYLHATFKVRNATQGGTAYTTPRTNLTFVAVASSGTVGGSAISSMKRFDGSAADPTIARTFLPTGGVTQNLTTGAIEATGSEVLQVFPESDVGALTRPAGVTTVLPYGFVVHNANAADGRTLPANPAAGQFDGVVTFAFKVPLQASSAADPFTVTALFLAIEDGETRITESLEEQRSTDIQALADALGPAASVMLLGNSTTVVTGHSERRLCRVRTAGTDPNAPAATLVNVGAPCATGVMTIPGNVVVVGGGGPVKGGTGHTWDTAFRFLQDALTCVRTESGPGEPCAGVDEIWVQSGLYEPDVSEGVSSGDPSSRFELIPGVGLYGGFAGTEHTRDQRTLDILEPSILDGTINTGVGEIGTAVNILYVNATGGRSFDSTTIVDGFAVRNGGRDDGTSIPILCAADGAGSECSPTFRHINVVGDNNTIVPMLVQASNGGRAAPRLEDVMFRDNLGGTRAGALAVVSGAGTNVLTPVLIRTTFRRNVSRSGGGAPGAVMVEPGRGTTEVRFYNTLFDGNTGAGVGAVELESSGSAPGLIQFTNTELVQNTGEFAGAIMALPGGSVVLQNSTVAGNTTGGSSEAISVSNAPLLTLSNSIIWGNTGSTQISLLGSFGASARHSVIQGGCPAGFATCSSVLSADPLFRNLATGELHLQGTSPAIGAGDNALLAVDAADLDGDGNTTEPIPVDLDGGARLADPSSGGGTAIVDMGAYERQAPPPPIAWTPLIENTFTVSAGVPARYVCTTIQVASDVYITGFHLEASDLTYRVRVSVSDIPFAQADGQMGDFQCDNAAGILNPSHGIYAAGIGTDDYLFPSGTGIHVKAGQYLLLNVAGRNMSSTSDAVVTTRVLVRAGQASDVTTEAEMVMAGRFSFILAATDAPQTVVGGCVQPADQHLLAIQPLGSLLSVRHAIYGNDVPILDTPFDVYHQRFYPVDVMLHEGDQVQFVGTYVNTTGSPVGSGDIFTTPRAEAALYVAPAMGRRVYACF